MSDITKRFELSAKMVKTLSTSPSNNELLELYGLYKQSTIGDCNTTEPSRFNMKDHAKWNAWKAIKGTKKNDAMNKYSDLVMTLIDKYN